MTDGIFTEDELKAEQTGAAEELKAPEETQEQKDQRERDEQGRFKAKEPETEAVAEEAGDKEKGGTVPQQALHAEREKRKASEDRERAKDAELAAAKEQLAALAKMREQISSRKATELPAADDPAQVEHLRTRLAELEQGQTRISQHIDTQAVNQAEMQQLGSVMHQSETKFREQKPDYDAAIDHVVKARAQELSLYGLTPPQIQQTIAEEATEIVRSAISQNRDPAELGYQIALSRGYRPAETVATNGGAQPSKAQQTIDAIAKAQAQSKSLGGAGGGKVQTLNAEAVLAMSPEEFDRVYSTPEGKAMIDSL
jgi:hypothetical protein